MCAFVSSSVCVRLCVIEYVSSSNRYSMERIRVKKVNPGSIYTPDLDENDNHLIISVIHNAEVQCKAVISHYYFIYFTFI